MERAALTVHIVAGSLGLIFGFIALFVAKGAQRHRSSGMAFVYAMMTMALMGSIMAAVWNVAPGANAPVGLLTAYLVLTGLITVRPPAAGWRRLDLGLMVVALAVGVVLFTFAELAFLNPKGKLYGMPPYPFFIFGTVALLSAFGDWRLIRTGGVQTLRGARRVTRHLWRMSFALLIAAFSFFLGQAKVIPKPIRIVPLLLIPPVVVLAALLYWLWRIRLKQSLRGITLRLSAPSTPGAPRPVDESPRRGTVLAS